MSPKNPEYGPVLFVSPRSVPIALLVIPAAAVLPEEVRHRRAGVELPQEDGAV